MRINPFRRREKYARGGVIQGPEGQHGDSVPALLSPGCYIPLPPGATAEQARLLLEAVNDMAPHIRAQADEGDEIDRSDP